MNTTETTMTSTIETETAVCDLCRAVEEFIDAVQAPPSDDVELDEIGAVDAAMIALEIRFGMAAETLVKHIGFRERTRIRVESELAAKAKKAKRAKKAA